MPDLRKQRSVANLRDEEIDAIIEGTRQYASIVRRMGNAAEESSRIFYATVAFGEEVKRLRALLKEKEDA